ncbi:unnamed protein product [Chilo suppressalis]|uniref:Uncharacterized protein n=1 Tax=Chilo suppressalis TaxID=168631 RepID=A0ABN8B113_CHISP|nr:unnamed protein product [Chilo suppressalis]
MSENQNVNMVDSEMSVCLSEDDKTPPNFITRRVQKTTHQSDSSQYDQLMKKHKEEIRIKLNKFEELQVSSRKSTFEIKNVPRKEKESKKDLIDMVINLSEVGDCTIFRSYINDIYMVRTKKPEQKNTPIIVNTNSALLKNDLQKKAKSFNIKNKTKLFAKHFGLKSNEDTPIFFLNT